MIGELAQISCIRVFPSETNFFLVELLDERLNAEAIVQNLARQDIYIRNPDSMSVQFGNRFLRIAVKNQESNREVIAALQAYFEHSVAQELPYSQFEAR